jgi:hypothetical protein
VIGWLSEWAQPAMAASARTMDEKRSKGFIKVVWRAPSNPRAAGGFLDLPRFPRCL